MPQIERVRHRLISHHSGYPPLSTRFGFWTPVRNAHLRRSDIEGVPVSFYERGTYPKINTGAKQGHTSAIMSKTPTYLLPVVQPNRGRHSEGSPRDRERRHHRTNFNLQQENSSRLNQTTLLHYLSTIVIVRRRKIASSDHHEATTTIRILQLNQNLPVTD